MSTLINLQPAYILHTRAYRETSLIVELFTPDYGRVSAVAKGARRPKSPLRGLLQPFKYLLVSWSGNSSLKTMRNVEDQYASLRLEGSCLYSGLYLNELLVRLLKPEDHHADGLFSAYESTLAKIMAEQPVEPVLREFERYLLDDLGYGVPFPEEVLSSDSMVESGSLADSLYYYASDGNFEQLEHEPNAAQIPRCFQGECLKAIANSDYAQKMTLRSAKRLMRLALHPLLGEQPLQSRQLFKH